jgi:hypothetical protein
MTAAAPKCGVEFDGNSVENSQPGKGQLECKCSWSSSMATGLRPTVVEREDSTDAQTTQLAIGEKGVDENFDCIFCNESMY